MIPMPSVNKVYSMTMCDEIQKMIAETYSGVDIGESSTSLYVVKPSSFHNQRMNFGSYSGSSVGYLGSDIKGEPSSSLYTSSGKGLSYNYKLKRKL